ncbi:hypothetical protein RCH20_002182 [Psychrobacter sp. PL15]|nr:hypothetical protein [Psychrobacter sp. PL15]
MLTYIYKILVDFTKINFTKPFKENNCFEVNCVNAG